MKESLLVKLALITSLAGILVLFLISGHIKVEEKPLDKISVENLEDYVKVNGMVTNVIDTDNVAILKITQPRDIDVVVFKNGPLNISKGANVEIIGKVDEYKNKAEIIAELIRVT